MTAPKVALGAALFVDARLSQSGQLACASCHDPDNHFADDKTRPVGAQGELLEFNSPTLLNSAYSTSLSWIDKGFSALEEQHLGPLTNTDPVELGTGQAQLAELFADPSLQQLVLAAFPRARELTLKQVAAALASYVRTLIRGATAFDRYLFADQQAALSAEAQRGLALFTSERLNCAACHRGFLLSGPTQSVRAQFPPSFYQTGVANSDLAFRVPSLRFVQHTAPYMHDGSLADLRAVIAFYAGGGARGGVGAGPKARERMRPFELNEGETLALLAFLQSL